MRWPERLALAALLAASGHTLAQDRAPTAQPPLALREATSLSAPPQDQAPASLWQKLRRCDDGSDRARGWLRHFTVGEGGAVPIFGTPCDVDWHKPIFILPYTYSRDYESDQTEVLFSVSAKLRPLGLPLYFAYSQRSYWSLYDATRSRPFRETVYNPEVFWRWMAAPPVERGFAWGMDGGYEHESNGRDIPESRSWDRLYLAPFIERSGTALQLKLWYRLPEDEKRDENDASGDDNPDIEDYLGHGELHLYRRFSRDRRFHAMLRGNLGTGHGAIQLEHSWRIGEGDLFWHAYAFHGYGESLSDYNDSVTRVGVGFALSR